MTDRVLTKAGSGFEGAVQHKNDRRLPYAQHRLDFPGKSAVFHGKTPVSHCLLRSLALAGNNRLAACFGQPSLTCLSSADRQVPAILETLRMRYQQTIEIHERIETVLSLIETGEYSTPALAEEVGVSIPTISRIVAALRERGHDIHAERTNKGWRYVLSHGTTARRAGRHAD
jgi:biotin operon repressor